MSKKLTSKSYNKNLSFIEHIAKRARRKIKAQHQTEEVWLGLGVMGIAGWSIVIPTLLGVALGVWIDKYYPGKYSWTLILLIVGLALGCLNVYRWIFREDHIKEEDTRK